MEIICRLNRQATRPIISLAAVDDLERLERAKDVDLTCLGILMHTSTIPYDCK